MALGRTGRGRSGRRRRFPARILATEPEFLVHAIALYRASPDRQNAIGTEGERDRLRREVDDSAVPLG